jgi:3-hydroxyisobutyrate dehydrogenase
MMSTAWRIGFVGVGMMGTPMVRCLLRAGYELFVADTEPARVAAFTDAGEAHLLEPRHAARLDALITMLPNSQIVERALLGGDPSGSGAASAAGAAGAAGWARHLPPGALVIDMSSSEPARSRQLAVTLAQLGLAYLDAPVSGGVRKAQSGSLAILVGGEAAVLERCRPLLRAMGASVLHVGAAGAGHAAKALNNYVSAAGLVAAVEALQVAARFGIAPAVMTEVLNASTGRNNTTENKLSQFMLSGTYASGFTLQLMVKDLKTAYALAQAVGYPMRFGAVCTAVWEEAGQRGSPTSDHTEMYHLLADEPAHGRG